MSKNAFLPQALVAGAAALTLTSLPRDTAARTLPEYTAAEARNHIGESATIVGKVDCIDHGRRHTDVLIGGCDLRKTLLWVVVPEEVSGSELECGQLRGVTIAVTGKIESSGGTPQTTIKSTSQIVPRTPLNPDYFSRAMEKQSQGDFDGAIADLDRAVELTHEADIYVQRAEVKQKKGDLDGAISDYDQLLEHYTKAEYYLSRARLKTKKGDYAGVIADSGRAIELYRHYYASHPNDHSTFVLAQAYSERGDAEEAMGDPAGAITDYENSVKNDPNAPIYKKKLKHAQAAAGPSHEQFSNNSEVTPESIAEAFVQAYSGTDVDAVAALYADRVDYTNSGVITNAAVRAQAKQYFARWPVRQWSLAGPVKTTSMGPSRQKLVFSATYDASNPQSNKHASGIAQETLIVASDADGAMKIVSQKEQTSKKGSSQSGEVTSRDVGLNAAKVEYERRPNDAAGRDEPAKLPDAEPHFAGKYVLRGYELPSGYAESKSSNGVEILKGTIHGSVQGVPWAAAVNAEGKILWAARAQEPAFTAAALTTDGQYLWSAAVLSGSGNFHLGKFKAENLQKVAAVQTTFPPTANLSPTFQLHFEREDNLQVSLQQILPNSIRLAVFSSEPRLVLDKTYSFARSLWGKEFNGPASMKLLPLPDGSGYYMVIESPVVRGKREPRIDLVRLDKSSGITWANTYAIGNYDNNLQSRVAQDGAVFLSTATYKDAEPEQSILIKVNPDGKVAWATAVKGLDASWDDFDSQFAFESSSYRFTEPFLLARATEQTGLDEEWWLRKTYSILFAINYQTGVVEKQVKFGANHPGTVTLAGCDAKSFYLSFWNETRFEKPSGHGHQAPQKPSQFHAAVLRFDYDLNFLSGLKLRNVAMDQPFLHLLGPNKVVISYPYDDQRGTTTIIVEAASANLESPNKCHWLEKENFVVSKSSFQQQPASITTSPLNSITVSDANSKISQADLALAPLDLKAVPCQAERK